MENSKAFSQILICPFRKARLTFSVLLYQLLQVPLCIFNIWCVEYPTDLRMHFWDSILTRDIASCILLKMELTSLPQNTGEYSIYGGAKSTMVIRTDQSQPVDTSFDQTFEKAAPVDFSFVESDFCVQNVPVAFIIHAKSYQ